MQFANLQHRGCIILLPLELVEACLPGQGMEGSNKMWANNTCLTQAKTQPNTPRYVAQLIELCSQWVANVIAALSKNISCASDRGAPHGATCGRHAHAYAWVSTSSLVNSRPGRNAVKVLLRLLSIRDVTTCTRPLIILLLYIYLSSLVVGEVAFWHVLKGQQSPAGVHRSHP